MFSFLRIFVAILAMAGVAGPSLAAVCVQQVERHCKPSEHACCSGPRLTQCDCGDTHGGADAEPAQRGTRLSKDTRVAATVVAAPVLPRVSVRRLGPEDAAPPSPTRERLSLLAVLLV